MGKFLVFRHGRRLNVGFGWQRADDHIVRRRSEIYERRIELDDWVENEVQSK